MAPGFIIWFTGLSGSGKSTLASLVSDRLRGEQVHVECLDGDEVRKHLSWGLGFSREDRDRNVRRIGYVARMVARSGSCAITAAISPYRSIRNEIRTQTDRFCEVYCECPLEVLAERDPKGLYRRAMAGEIKNFTGVDDPYEAPEDPEVHLHTDRQTPQECVELIIAKLKDLGFVSGIDEERELPAPYGGELVQAAVAPLEEGRAIDGTIDVDDALRDLSLTVAAGFASPVGGFMTRRELEKVRSAGMLERGLAWTYPIELAISESAAGFAREDGFVLLANRDVPFARLHVQGVWSSAPGRTSVAGLLEAVSPDGALPMTARQIRASMGAKGLRACAVVFARGAATSTLMAQARVAAAATGGAVVFCAPEHVEDYRAGLRGSAEVLPIPPGLRPASAAPLREVAAKNLGGLCAVELV